MGAGRPAADDRGMTDTVLHLLADQLAVTEALYRYAAGVDLKDESLFASSLAVDAISDNSPATAKIGLDYPAMHGRDTIVSAVLGSLAPFDTTHLVSNPRVTIDGDKAHLEAVVSAQHLPKADHSRHLLMTNRYDAELIREGDVWVLHRLTVDNVWLDGDPSVLAGV
ncbi:hypothetical protein L3i22_067360 [Actinoplanes sp. L3-i22]|nr:hypothetical protein L3i22_067360 [Actinoplanes sp. L3-i22]